MGWLKEVIPEDLRRFLMGGYLKLLPTASGWTETDVGSGAGTPYIAVLDLVTGATENSSVLFTAPSDGVNIADTNSARIDWTKRIAFGCHIRRLTSIATALAYVQLKEATTIGQLGEKGIGFTMTNLALIGESYGSERGVTGTLATMTSSKNYRVAAIYTPGVGVDFYLNGVSAGSQRTAAAFPSSAVGAANAGLAVSITNGAGAACELRCGDFWVWQQM